MSATFCTSENRTHKSDDEKRCHLAAPTQAIDFKRWHEIRATEKQTHLIDIKRLSEIRTNASIGYVTDLIRLDVLRPNKLSMQPIDNKSESEIRTRFKTPLRQRNAPLTPTRPSATLPEVAAKSATGFSSSTDIGAQAPPIIV